MSGSIYDRLKNVLDVQNQEEGISAGDIAALPPALRRIMRLMLRKVLRRKIASAPHPCG